MPTNTPMTVCKYKLGKEFIQYYFIHFYILFSRLCAVSTKFFLLNGRINYPFSEKALGTSGFKLLTHFHCFLCLSTVTFHKIMKKMFYDNILDKLLAEFTKLEEMLLC